MGMIDDLFKGKVVTGLAIGVGAAFVAPKILPILGEAVKPLAKGAMKGGMLIYEKGKETVAEVAEMTEDMWAEVKAEMKEEHENFEIEDIGSEGEGGDKTS